MLLSKFSTSSKFSIFPKLLTFSILFSFSTGISSAQKVGRESVKLNKTQTSLTKESIKTETDQIFNKLVEIRRDLHENPELARKEFRTKHIIAQYLIKLGLEVDTNIYANGVVGILKGGRPGKKIAWRADMDALPNDFPDPVSFKSKIKGVQHGCGHDVHVAVGLGIAEVLAINKEALPGTVYFIFQPEEETFLGAKEMINNGLLNKIHPDEIYGLHVSALPVGQITVKPSELFAYQKRIRIQLKNEVTAEAAKALSNKIYVALSRAVAGTKPWELQNIVDPQIGVTNPNTIFKDYLIIDERFTNYAKNDMRFLEAYIYETNLSNVKNIIPEVKQVIEDNGFKDQLLSISYTQENPTVINDEKLTNAAIKTLGRIYGNGVVKVDYGQIPYFNDDFAYFQQKIPGVYFILGGSNAEKGIIALNHSPNFQVDEECIRSGVKYFSSLIVERLR